MFKTIPHSSNIIMLGNFSSIALNESINSHAITVILQKRNITDRQTV